MFKIENVSKKYGTEYALKNVSLTIGKGLNFIVGSSGSGKTTLLKIISGIEPNFDGEAYYFNRNIKEITGNEKSYFYNNTIGFIWQNFNLLEEISVLENVLIPTLLKEGNHLKEARRILKSLNLSKFANQKVKTLSGGQKQRVAIARELMKKPEVILADEPTSALDEKMSKEFMKVLRMIAKNRTVIIVTHDTSLIEDKDQVYELDKGELIASKNSIVDTKSDSIAKVKYNFSFNKAISLARVNIKYHAIRFMVLILTLVIATSLLLTTFGGSISSSGKESFDKLIATYGETILDMQLAGSFMNASGVEGSDKDNPSGNVSQNIGGLYEKYKSDNRVQFALSSKAYDNISITMDGKSYRIESSGSAPVINKLISGKMPDENKNEVIVSKSFLEKSGYDQNTILGKEIDFSSEVYNWQSGQPVAKKVGIKAKVAGVADNKAVYEAEGKTFDYTVDDSFFFSKVAQDDMQKQAGLSDNEMSFVIRAKSPKDLISIKDELNKSGIIPIGQFELLEDIVRMGDQTNQQSGLANVVIASLSVVMIIAIFTITHSMRRKEYAIYKISGFANTHLRLLSFIEVLMQGILAVMLLFVLSPILNMITSSFLQVSIISMHTLLLAISLTLLLTLVAFILNLIILKRVNIVKELKSGDK